MQTPEPPTRPGHADYAEPVRLPSSRSKTARPPSQVRLWGGSGRRVLQWSCVVTSLVLAGVLVVALLRDRPGAASPEAAVSELIQGIADLDGAAIVSVVAPDEVADVERADAAYARLAERVVLVAQPPPPEVERVLAAAEDQLAGTFSRQALGVLAAVDLDLDDLSLAVEEIDASTARVFLRGGVLALTLDPDRLPVGVDVGGGGVEPTGFDLTLAEGWQRDGRSIVAYLVVIEVDGRWFVSLEASADDLLAPR